LYGCVKKRKAVKCFGNIIINERKYMLITFRIQILISFPRKSRRCISSAGLKIWLSSLVAIFSRVYTGTYLHKLISMEQVTLFSLILLLLLLSSLLLICAAGYTYGRRVKCKYVLPAFATSAIIIFKYSLRRRNPA